MKFTLILTCMILYVTIIGAQQRCRGAFRPTRLNPRSCTADIDSGHSLNIDCRRNGNMWAYSQRRRRCVKFTYLGCAGNGNRYCSQRDCNARCPPRSTN
ncbi:kunitz-type serine protease inhibitor A-like [Drosophila busckii]|uniref:kunitz-type serine protease inhibitor A-like n=1 Tax=Drosophila busckii TaxID=30019 RepID=UPI00083EA7B1|nr:kunitz-type serine protease inhibitor A-like [Drosophila busckii]